MKLIGKRLSLAIVLLFSALLMLCGGAGFLTAHAQETKAAATHEGDFYALPYAEDEPYDTLIDRYYEELYVYDDNGEFNGELNIAPVEAAEYKKYEKLLNAALNGDYAGKVSKLGAAYDIVFTVDGEEVAEPGEMRIRMQIPEELSGEGKTLVIVHFTENGAELVEAASDGGYYEFRASDFTAHVYGIAEIRDEEAASLWWLWLLIALIIVFLIAAIVLLSFLLIKKNVAEGAAEEPADEHAEEQPFEKPAEEPAEK